MKLTTTLKSLLYQLSSFLLLCDVGVTGFLPCLAPSLFRRPQGKLPAQGTTSCGCRLSSSRAATPGANLDNKTGQHISDTVRENSSFVVAFGFSREEGLAAEKALQLVLDGHPVTTATPSRPSPQPVRLVDTSTVDLRLATLRDVSGTSMMGNLKPFSPCSYTL